MESDLNTFLEIEARYNLYNKSILGIQYWNYVRTDFYFRCMQKKENLGAQHESSSPSFSIIKEIVPACLHHPTKSNIDVLFVGHPRRVMRDNFYEDIYSSHLIKHFPNSLVLEEPYPITHRKPIKNPENVCYTDYINICAYIATFISKTLKLNIYKNTKKEIIQSLSGAIIEFKNAFDIDIPIDTEIDIIVRKTLKFYYKQKQFAKLIHKISPKVIVEVVSYGSASSIINCIAKNQVIPTIELQHGAIYKEHIAYNYGLYQKPINQLPDFLLSFGNYWGTQIHLPAQTKIIPAGFPYLEQQLSEFNSAPKTSKKRKILFISQGSIGMSLSRIANDLAKSIDLSHFEIVYKLHPGEYAIWKERYSEMASLPITIVGNSDLSLYQLFHECDIQVGVYSTALYEGIAFGLSTYIYNMAYSDAMKGLVESGYASYFSTVSELLNMIVATPKKSYHTNEIWEQDSTTKQIEVIKRMLSTSNEHK